MDFRHENLQVRCETIIIMAREHSLAAFRPDIIDQAESLILAAPDLLAACKAALYLLGNDADRQSIGAKPWDKRGAEHMLPMARAAIAAAEGRKA
jgi:hypothetical protein